MRERYHTCVKESILSAIVDGILTEINTSFLFMTMKNSACDDLRNYVSRWKLCYVLEDISFTDVLGKIF